MPFGEFVRSLRKRNRYGLRDFCIDHGYDPSNWSKIERGVKPAPKSNEVLTSIAVSLGLKNNTEEWSEFFDLADLSRGRLPEDIRSDDRILEQLPVFFRTIRGNKPEEDELVKIYHLIKDD